MKLKIALNIIWILLFSALIFYVFIDGFNLLYFLIYTAALVINVVALFNKVRYLKWAKIYKKD